MPKAVMDYVRDHYAEAREYFPEDRIVGIFLQGSQNYNLQVPGSDVDTKLIVVPTFDDIVFNRKAVSTTHVRQNNEHIDFKDIRLYTETFRNQNLNFLEILFTDFKWVNHMYAEHWDQLIKHREEIAHYNLYQAIKSMKGIAMEKYHAMEHPYPSKVDVLAEYGNDPKQLHHLLRVEEYIGRYIAGEPYEDCLRPRRPEYLIEVKRGYYDLETARVIGKTAISNIERIADAFTEKVEDKGDPVVDELLDSVQYNIMEKAIKMEMKGEYAAVREMRKHVGWYLKGVHGAAAFRGAVNKITDGKNGYGFLMKDGKAVIDNTLCVGCGVCKQLCAFGAISDGEVK